MPNQLGKRFVCDVCNTEVLCIKAGDGAVECCGKAMELMQPKVLPSADWRDTMEDWGRPLGGLFDFQPCHPES